MINDVGGVLNKRYVWYVRELPEALSKETMKRKRKRLKKERPSQSSKANNFVTSFLWPMVPELLTDSIRS